MKIRVLGCDGSYGGKGILTTSFLVDDDILIDAGTGVATLSISELARIDHVFVTHAHLDHIVMLPFLVDLVGTMRDKPVTVYAQEETLDTLKNHIFNWKVWPDFAKIAFDKNKAPFAMAYRSVAVGEKVLLGNRTIVPLPAVHSVPAVGYLLDSGKASLAFTGDTYINDALWPLLNAQDRLRYLLIETTFPNREKQLAIASRHLYPEILFSELKRLRIDKKNRDISIYVCHFKLPYATELMEELKTGARGKIMPMQLREGQVFQF